MASRSTVSSIGPESPWPEAAKNEAYASGVSWTAVIAGAFGAAALSLILLALGTGFGLSATSPIPAPEILVA